MNNRELKSENNLSHVVSHKSTSGKSDCQVRWTIHSVYSSSFKGSQKTIMYRGLWMIIFSIVI